MQHISQKLQKVDRVALRLKKKKVRKNRNSVIVYYSIVIILHEFIVDAKKPKHKFIIS